MWQLVLVLELQRLNPQHHSHEGEVILQSLHFQLLQGLGLLFLYLHMVCTMKFIVSLCGKRLKGKGKRIRARYHARGRREEGTLPPSSRAQKPKTMIGVKSNPNVPCMISGLEVSANSLQTVQGGGRPMLGVED